MCIRDSVNEVRGLQTRVHGPVSYTHLDVYKRQGEERRATYSPFLPISPKTGRVLYVPMKSIDAEAGTITFDDEDGEEITIPVSYTHLDVYKRQYVC